MATIDITKLSKDVLDYPDAEVRPEKKDLGTGSPALFCAVWWKVRSQDNFKVELDVRTKKKRRFPKIQDPQNPWLFKAFLGKPPFWILGVSDAVRHASCPWVSPARTWRRPMASPGIVRTSWLRIPTRRWALGYLQPDCLGYMFRQKQTFSG